MKFITFIVASEGHYITDGKRYDKSIRYEDGTEVSELREITDEEYYEMFPNEKPVEEEVVEGEVIAGAVELEVIEPTDENITENEEIVNENI